MNRVIGGIYLLISKCKTRYKIGQAVDIFKRIKTLTSKWDISLEESYYVETENLNNLERGLHRLLAKHKIYGLPIQNGYTEWFEIESLANCFKLLDLQGYIYQKGISNKEVSDIKFPQTSVKKPKNLINPVLYFARKLELNEKYKQANLQSAKELINELKSETPLKGVYCVTNSNSCLLYNKGLWQKTQTSKSKNYTFEFTVKNRNFSSRGEWKQENGEGSTYVGVHFNNDSKSSIVCFKIQIYDLPNPAVSDSANYLLKEMKSLCLSIKRESAISSL